jgi:hypothetical protein
MVNAMLDAQVIKLAFVNTQAQTDIADTVPAGQLAEE